MGRHLIDLTGKVFGRLTVIKRGSDYVKPYGGPSSTMPRWVCVCACGAEALVRGQDLKAGVTVSCGCLAKEVSAASAVQKFTTHGHGGAGKRTKTYVSWYNMLARCRNPNAKEFAHYGGRGIKVFGQWEVFENFLNDMGERPEGKFLDRIDNDGNYEPGNCEWTTRSEQARNRSNTKQVTIGTETMCIVDWAIRLKVPKTTLYRWHKAGKWPL